MQPDDLGIHRKPSQNTVNGVPTINPRNKRSSNALVGRLPRVKRLPRKPYISCPKNATAIFARVFHRRNQIATYDTVRSTRLSSEKQNCYDTASMPHDREPSPPLEIAPPSPPSPELEAKLLWNKLPPIRLREPSL